MACGALSAHEQPRVEALLAQHRRPLPPALASEWVSAWSVSGDLVLDPFCQDLTVARAALNVLNRDPDGFAVIIEGGAVDWANHANQKGRMIEEQMDFNAAVAAVVDWVDTNSNWDETLLIVTADHETGYLWGSDSGPAGSGKERSNPRCFAPIRDNGTGVMPGMTYYSGGHTNSLVPLYAKGAGVDLFAHQTWDFDQVRGGYVNNTAIFDVMERTISGFPRSCAILSGGRVETQQVASTR